MVDDSQASFDIVLHVHTIAMQNPSNTENRPTTDSVEPSLIPNGPMEMGFK